MQVGTANRCRSDFNDRIARIDNFGIWYRFNLDVFSTIDPLVGWVDEGNPTLAR
jgi:hypothetical protein